MICQTHHLTSSTTAASSSISFRRATRGCNATSSANAAKNIRRPSTSSAAAALFGRPKSKPSGSSFAPVTTPPTDIIPGQGRGSPKWPELHDRLKKEFGVKAVEAEDLAEFLAKGKGTLVDVRQTIEYDEWRLKPSVNVPYAIPDPNIIRRAVGYAISIKGGLKVRNPDFVETCAAVVGNAKTVVVIDTKGGDLEVEPTRKGSGTLDATDSSALRAAFELCQAGCRDVRYVRGGLPGAIEAGRVVEIMRVPDPAERDRAGAEPKGPPLGLTPSITLHTLKRSSVLHA